MSENDLLPSASAAPQLRGASEGGRESLGAWVLDLTRCLVIPSEGVFHLGIGQPSSDATLGALNGVRQQLYLSVAFHGPSPLRSAPD